LFVTWFYASLREAHATREIAETTIRLSIEQGFPFWSSVGAVFRGWALAEQGQAAQGIIQMQQGLSDWRTTGAEICQSYLLALLAETHSKVGQVEDGLTVVAEALTRVEKTRERFWEADLYRLKGELLLKQDQTEMEVQACFRQAIQLAQHQQAKFLELRATVSLARLWQAQGKGAEARQMLAEIYDWFTEGFDTVDLREAQALLEELS
jgi:predicted ATPase